MRIGEGSELVQEPIPLPTLRRARRGCRPRVLLFRTSISLEIRPHGCSNNTGRVGADGQDVVASRGEPIAAAPGRTTSPPYRIARGINLHLSAAANRGRSRACCSNHSRWAPLGLLCFWRLDSSRRQGPRRRGAVQCDEFIMPTGRADRAGGTQPRRAT